ncbi:hypothetical protein JCM5805K_0921 [Lactococcus lactis subsp. lactis]|uniref:Uncharacterized protein n=1 Tax=Lactococcus lactis subsp. lactis TaxID=1360 RepID=A0A0B8QY13_LACLL|nr:hypothetical protein JCM5805K_0921 [Lactococcus lactis subsp. lactis]
MYSIEILTGASEYPANKKAKKLLTEIFSQKTSN